MAAKKTTETFESALERIEQIAARMEGNEVPLEQLIVDYEEGLRLVRFCTERLDAADKRLESITRNTAGEPQPLPTTLAPTQNPEEIQPSTTPESSGREGNSPGAGSPSDPARLF
jgi:exodeoxyribonuclease VII small subunit